VIPYSLREAFAAFRRSPLLTGLSVTMIALSLLVVGLFAIAAYNIRRVLDRVEERVEVVAYLRDNADFLEVEKARQELLKTHGVRAVRYVSREEALQIARKELPEFGTLFGGLDANPLPASLEIALTSHQQNADAVRAIAQRVSQFPFVEDVSFGRDWLDKVYLLRRVAGAATIILGGAFALVAGLIIGAAVRIAVFARRDEIGIMRLVGATDGFVRRPFILEGLMTGIMGGILALALTYIAHRILKESLFPLEWMPDLWVAGILALGGVFGGLASAIAVRRHLQEI
jgi:cell division transport system permease protein